MFEWTKFDKIGKILDNIQQGSLLLGKVDKFWHSPTKWCLSGFAKPYGGFIWFDGFCITLEQWFSTGDPRQTRGPWDIVLGASSYYFCWSLDLFLGCRQIVMLLSKGAASQKRLRNTTLEDRYNFLFRVKLVPERVVKELLCRRNLNLIIKLSLEESLRTYQI